MLPVTRLICKNPAFIVERDLPLSALGAFEQVGGFATALPPTIRSRTAAESESSPDLLTWAVYRHSVWQIKDNDKLFRL